MMLQTLCRLYRATLRPQVSLMFIEAAGDTHGSAGKQALYIFSVLCLDLCARTSRSKVLI